MQKPDRIRALDRGLDVLEHLSRHSRVTLADLRKATGLSNATLFRVLETLRHRGWVRRNIVEGHYELSHALGNLLGEGSRAHPLAEIAGDHLLELLGAQSGLPSDLCTIVEAGKIEIIESTRLRGSMAPTRTAFGLRPSMVFSAHGRAILAFSEASTRTRHVEKILQFASRDDTAWINSGALAQEIAETRERGYGLRHKAFWAPPFDPGPELGALAVPILSKSGLHGTLSVLWITDDMSLDDVLGYGCLDNLRRTCAKIGVALDKARIAAPKI